MSDSIVIPAFQQVTPNNHGPWVVVTAYIFLPLSILVVVIRLVTRFQLARSINLNDGVIVISMVCWNTHLETSPTDQYHSFWRSSKLYV